MLRVPDDRNPFKWTEIHLLAKAKLASLDTAIRKEIDECPDELPPNLGGARHQFFVLLKERAVDWTLRAKNAYLDCLTEVGREPSQSIRLSIWQNGLRWFVSENVNEYLILACGITKEERKRAIGPEPERSTPKMKEVIFTLHQIGGVVQAVFSQFQAEMKSTGNWLADTQQLMMDIRKNNPHLKEDIFVAGRGRASVPPAHPEARLNTPDLPASSPWEQLSLEFSRLASVEKSVRVAPMSVIGIPELNASSDLSEWTFNDALSEHFRAQFEVLASRAGNALAPLPVNASPFQYWLHRLYQHLRQHRSKYSRYYTSSEMEAPLIDSVCEASSTFCLRLQQQKLEGKSNNMELAEYFQQWIENNSVSVSIPSNVSDRHRISTVAQCATVSIPIHFLSIRLLRISLPRGSTVFPSPRRLFDQIAENHGLIWVITRDGLWMAQQPPNEEYIDAHGMPRCSTPMEKPTFQPPHRPKPKGSHSSFSRKPAGRKPTRNPGFVIFVAGLWKRHQDSSRRVSDSSLKQIATALDRSLFSDPAEWLEGTAARNLREHNRNFGNSRRLIKNWVELVASNEPNFKPAMRKLLSRCANAPGNQLPDKK
ncbi:hypothetical protein [Occallatibacter savannae]|uniref:hypothetical protein n=1 Tax=Occallatibacter savannae TaxID=1002691 RepID=UPI000D697B42|nr:hypothetical protein [Occallatibacter savannae]